MAELFKTNYNYIETERQQKDFSWDKLNIELGLPYATGEKLRLNYKNWRQKNNLITRNTTAVHNGTPTTDISEGKFIVDYQNEDLSKGTKEFKFTADKIPTHQEIIDHFNIDTKKYRINQIYHKTSFGGKYSITVSVLALKQNETLHIDNSFVESLNKVNIFCSKIKNNYSPTDKPKSCLIIPKQDAHWNKLDVEGNNCMEDRFKEFVANISVQLNKAIKTNYLEKIVYVVGSDEFNSEYTGATTKGTPQQNILSYQEAFEKVSLFSIEFIKLLKSYSDKVEVVLLNGNHDHNVSWHLANLLKHVFSLTEGISVDSSLVNTKIVSYGSNLILLNHGDEMKPKDLAYKFPIIAKDDWSNFENYFVITGDKHHEVAHDFNGVRTYQVPQLSKAKSSWDDKKGHVCSKPELVTFLFEEEELSTIYRKTL